MWVLVLGRVALMKAQSIEGPVGASPACCHSEQSEESLRGLRTAMTVTERFFASLRMTLSWRVAKPLSGLEFTGGAPLWCSRVRVFRSSILPFPLADSDLSFILARRVPCGRKFYTLAVHGERSR